MVDHDSIRDVAKRIYKEFATFDPFKICLYKDILVQYAPLGSLNAHYSKLYRIPIITINADLDDALPSLPAFTSWPFVFKTQRQ